MLKKGFALMDERRKKEIASLGGKTAHRLNKAHKFSFEEARLAGRKGGLASSAAGDKVVYLSINKKKFKRN